MFSIQECVSKTAEQRKRVENYMDRNGYFDHQECNIYEGLKRSTQRELAETLRKASLRDLLKEWITTPKALATGTLGAAGVNYLVPTWLSQKLYAAGASTDLAPLLSADIMEPDGNESTIPTGILKAHRAGEAELPHGAVIAPTQATVSLIKYVVPIVITQEMGEDNEFGLMEWNIQKSGEAMGRVANDDLLSALFTATDGYGTLAAVAGAAGETLPLHIMEAFDAVGVGDGMIQPICNTMVITPEAWEHSVSDDATAAYFPTGIGTGAPATGFDLKFHMLDTKFSASQSLATGGAGTAMTACKTIVFDRRQALVTARKNWLRIENYVEPVKDLMGAVVTGRQDSVTVVDEAVGVVTET